jgi:hypothetical protein
VFATDGLEGGLAAGGIVHAERNAVVPLERGLSHIALEVAGFFMQP